MASYVWVSVLQAQKDALSCLSSQLVDGSGSNRTWVSAQMEMQLQLERSLSLSPMGSFHVSPVGQTTWSRLPSSPNIHPDSSQMRPE